MRVSGATLQDLFADALRGLIDVMKPEGPEADRVHSEIRVVAPDVTALLVDFLTDVLTSCHIRREAYPRVVFSSLTGTALEGQLEGHPVAGFGEDVKAVTYHEAEVRERDGVWSTILVFDI